MSCTSKLMTRVRLPSAALIQGSSDGRAFFMPKCLFYKELGVYLEHSLFRHIENFTAFCWKIFMIFVFFGDRHKIRHKRRNKKLYNSEAFKIKISPFSMRRFYEKVLSD